MTVTRVLELRGFRLAITSRYNVSRGVPTISGNTSQIDFPIKSEVVIFRNCGSRLKKVNFQFLSRAMRLPLIESRIEEVSL